MKFESSSKTLSSSASPTIDKSKFNRIDHEDIQNWLITSLSKELDLNEEIDIYEPLAHYGLSSMTAVGLAGDLEDWLDIKLPATLAWDYPSIEEISKFVFSEIK